ncbi:uncharacterized protein KD926_004099 [Aspergillus affinis]|uniref:uncharacterized protein n=1 Tax=Aspergillus affinis TaxID=1070780 RepID=UPI0022FEDB51|nr:uncharacterized protein KD926_004099 [Aspergillus affinis]KAI9046261.1 hypothetical protein KD926_004099 [Aspergillus affinis]
MSSLHGLAPVRKDVIIIGGSLSGLLHGIILHRLGCSVRILEKSPRSTPVSHMAGVALGPDVLQFLSRFDCVQDVASLGIPSELLQSLDSNGQPHPFLYATRIMSSWGALYFRLRANYDGLSSEYKNAVARRYAGYVAWRGVVRESEVSDETQHIFRKNITYSVLKSHGAHVIVYYIPGEAGSVEPGQRLLNFCWYSNENTSHLDSILTDTSGHKHRITVPPHRLRPEIWARQQKLAETILAPPYLEIVRKISAPFVHLITDHCSPQASFLNGKVLLVGDASALLRPHIAFSTNQAAYQAGLTERLVKGDIRLDEWEYQVTVATHLHWRRSVWFGNFFQRSWPSALWSAVLYWALVVVNAIRTWMGWLPKQAV